MLQYSPIHFADQVYLEIDLDDWIRPLKKIRIWIRLDEWAVGFTLTLNLVFIYFIYYLFTY